MRLPRRIAMLATVIAAMTLTPAARAEVSVMFGTSWDGSTRTLQKIVDGLYGPGKINVETDYIGHHPGDLDPWFWVDNSFSAFLVREVAGNANYNVLGWYEETGTGTKPVIDGVNDGIVFDGPSGSGASTVITFNHPMTKFGFYLDPGGPAGGVLFAAQPECFWSNRIYNDCGPGGAALHAPTDGDVQSLVFDISTVVGQANTWLVCFEDMDSGSMPAGCCTPTDNDFNDFVFEVHAFGATPARPMSIAQIKNLYR